MTRHSDADERAINALTHHLRTNPTTRPHELAEQLLGLLRGMGWRYVPRPVPPRQGAAPPPNWCTATPLRSAPISPPWRRNATAPRGATGDRTRTPAGKKACGIAGEDGPRSRSDAR